MRSCIEWYYFLVRWPMAVLYMPLVSFDQTNFNGVWSISKLFGAISPISLRAKPETRTDAIFLTFGVPSSLDHEQHRVLPLLTKTLDWKMDALEKQSIWTKQEWVCWWSVQWLNWTKWKKYRAYDSIATFLKSTEIMLVFPATNYVCTVDKGLSLTTLYDYTLWSRPMQREIAQNGDLRPSCLFIDIL